MTTEPKLDQLILQAAADGNDLYQTVEDSRYEKLLSYSTEAEVNIDNAEDAQLCVLVYGGRHDAASPDPNVAYSKAKITVDGKSITPGVSSTKDEFSAAGIREPEIWKWFTVPVPAGKHTIAVQVTTPVPEAKFAVYLRGRIDAGPLAEPFDDGPVFPGYKSDTRGWSKTILPLTNYKMAGAPERSVAKQVTSIDGVYLDAMEWKTVEGNVKRRMSVNDNSIFLDGREYERGLGTIADSKLVVDIPQDSSTFAATIGAGVEAYYNTHARFIVEVDGKQLYRSKMLRLSHDGIDIELPVAGAKELTLIVERVFTDIPTDDVGFWVNARLLR